MIWMITKFWGIPGHAGGFGQQLPEPRPMFRIHHPTFDHDPAEADAADGGWSSHSSSSSRSYSRLGSHRKIWFQKSSLPIHIDPHITLVGEPPAENDSGAIHFWAPCPHLSSVQQLSQPRVCERDVDMVGTLDQYIPGSQLPELTSSK